MPFGDNKDAPWYGENILSVGQFSLDDLNFIFDIAHEMGVMVNSLGTFDLLKGKILANMFYEPSTRTMSCFTSAMERLGGSVIPIFAQQYSSERPEAALPDWVRTVEAYADVIVLRHPTIGSSKIAAQYAHKPVINAGEGETGEHPTQALLDIFSIREEMGQISGLNITIIGSLKNRAIRSLIRLLMLFHDITVTLISTSEQFFDEEFLQEVARVGTLILINKSVLDETILSFTDVLYVTQGTDIVVTPELLDLAKPKITILHPFPRGPELPMEIDSDPRAAYFRQMEYGLYVRMALLAMVLGKA
ncbi:hypothetical protein A2X44_01680 [candidate division CPR3 bacterium GWF2_35_18]|nr:MAG: hypothetical protein A2X44_01680 [candidate division CPR3 bacterium GWF2_35_18]OGB65773.1 MAG: hypothetical protein A2250_01940 [candidate division CPR3 bacterium RIFOXYA2_FULL_35_13]